jgi:hypothetical protein
VCSPAEYWARVKRIPLFFDRETDDGEAAIYRNQNGHPVRIAKPETLQTDDDLLLREHLYRSPKLTLDSRSHPSDHAPLSNR